MADLTQYIRKGEGFSIEVDADDATATSATLKIGTPGNVLLTSSAATLTNGVGTITVSDAQNTLTTGTYQYQIGVTYSSGATDIFPDPTKSAQELPSFVVAESLE